MIPSPHRVSFDLGLFDIPKEDDRGYALGVGYAFRPVNGLELGCGLRFFYAPAKYLDFDTREWSLAASVRGFAQVASADRVELGVTLRGGALALNNSGLCCVQVALAPDVRVRVARSTALQLAAEVAIGSTGAPTTPTPTVWTPCSCNERFGCRSCRLCKKLLVPFADPVTRAFGPHSTSAPQQLFPGDGVRSRRRDVAH